MAVYEYPTRTEEKQQKPVPSRFQLTREQKLEQNKYSGKHFVSPDSQCFDISAAWYNHPRPFTFHTVRPVTPHPGRLRHDQRGKLMTPYSVLLGHDQTSRLMAPHPLFLQHKVPGILQRSSSDSAVSQDVEKLRHCGDFRTHNGSGAETNSYHVFADSEREWECPDAQSPSSADMVRARSHEVNSPARHHRRHSLFYEPPLPSFDEEMKLSQMHSAHLRKESTRREENPNPLNEDSNSLELGSSLLQESTPLEEESTSLEEESTLLEQESTLLEQESTPLEHAHAYEDPYYPGAEEQLSCLKVKQEEAQSQCRVQKARKQLWFGNARLPSAAISNFHQSVAARAYAEDHPQGMTEVVNEEYFYGKYV